MWQGSLVAIFVTGWVVPFAKVTLVIPSEGTVPRCNLLTVSSLIKLRFALLSTSTDTNPFFFTLALKAKKSWVLFLVSSALLIWAGADTDFRGCRICAKTHKQLTQSFIIS